MRRSTFRSISGDRSTLPPFRAALRRGPAAVPADLAGRDGRARLGAVRRHHRHGRCLRRSSELRHGASSGGCSRSRGFKVGIIAQPDWHGTARLHEPRRAAAVLRRHRRQHGFDGEPLHLGSPGAQRRCVHAGRRGRQAAGPLRHRVLAALARGLQGRAHRDRRHRGEPAPHRAFRLLVGPGPPLACWSTPRRIFWCTATRSGRSSRSRSGSTRASRSATSPICAAPRILRRAVPGRLGRDRFERARHAGAARTAGRPLCRRGGARADLRPLRRRAPRAPPGRAVTRWCKFFRKVPNAAARAQRHPAALLRGGERGCGAVCARLANPAPGVESRQRARARAAPRQQRAVAQSAAAAADHGRHGRDLRAALCAPAASRLRRRADSRPTT